MSVRVSSFVHQPPARGISLGMRLGILTTLIVTSTMAAISGAQLWLDLSVQLSDQQRRLGESLAPLVVELGTAQTRRAAQRALDNFQGAHSGQGHGHHHLVVADQAGRTLIATTTSLESSPPRTLHSAVPVMVPALGPEEHTLTVSTTATDFFARRNRSWKDWAIHVCITAVVTLAMLFLVIRREVTRPIDRLLDAVRKMELGYWEDIPDPGGAWELRWLGWRFSALGQELSFTVENLVAAQRRAFAMEPDAPDVHDAREGIPPKAGDATVLHAGAVLARMQGRLARLGCADARCATDRALAQLVWDDEAPLAERLGRPDLSAALEDAALKVLDPDGFDEVCREIEQNRTHLEGLAREREQQLVSALTARGVCIIAIEWRIKHSAGVWRKMQLKRLRVEQVHDLVALRIIVPAEADCYHALGVVHDQYSPIVGRFKDYIAAPKSNGYRSLHCSVRDSDGSVFEVQIRSSAMHSHAETGSASHAKYRDASRLRQTARYVSPWRRIAASMQSFLAGSRRE